MKKAVAIVREAIFSLRFGRGLRCAAALLLTMSLAAVTVSSSLALYWAAEPLNYSEEYYGVYDNFVGEYEEALVNDPERIEKLSSLIEGMRDIEGATYLEVYGHPVYVYNFAIPSLNQVDGFFVGQNVGEHFALQFSSGGYFTDEVFEYRGGETQILLGADYGEYYKVGDVIEIDDVLDHRTAIVIGILRENSYLIDDGVRLINLDDRVLVPLADYIPAAAPEADIRAVYRMYMMKINGEFYTARSDEYVQARVNEIMDEIGLYPPCQVAGATNAVSYKIGMSLQQLMRLIAAAGAAVLALCAVITAFSIKNGLKKDLKYYAALLVGGFSESDLAALFGIRYIIAAASAYAVSLVLCAAAMPTLFGSGALWWPSAAAGALLCATEYFIALKQIKAADIAKYMQENV